MHIELIYHKERESSHSIFAIRDVKFIFLKLHSKPNEGLKNNVFRGDEERAGIRKIIATWGYFDSLAHHLTLLLILYSPRGIE